MKTPDNNYEWPRRFPARIESAKETPSSGSERRLVLPERPVTYRELHEDAAGMGLDGSFFAVSKIDPDAPVKCNCEWNEGHEEHCDIVAANRILIQRQNAES